MSDALDWDEFRLVRAIAETHSLYGAASRLGLNHSTMFRRLTALETRLGLKLFERDRSGYRPTAAGEDMAALAALMGETIAEFERRVGGQSLQLSGQVRLSTVETLGCLVLPKLLAEFHAAYPAVQIELGISEAQLDLVGSEVDLALRVVRGPPPGEYAAVRLGLSRWAVYASPMLIPPGEEDRLKAAPWIAPTPGAGPSQAQRWIARNVDPSRHVARANSVIALAELAAQGFGAALIPCLVGDANSALRKVADADGEADGDIWLVAAPHSLRKARVRALHKHLADAIGRRFGPPRDQSEP